MSTPLASFSLSGTNPKDFAVISPIITRLFDGIVQESMDHMPDGSDPLDDSPFERTLCAAWDVSTVLDYAQVLASTECHRALIKITTTTKRPRTRELAMGVLANMACHWDPIGRMLLQDMDILRLCRSILWHENDAQVLLETTRLLNIFFKCSVDTAQQTIVEHDHLTEFLVPQPVAPSVFHQLTQIICNTLHSELLLTGLDVMTRMVVYIKAILTEQQDVSFYMDVMDAFRLMQWGTERLEEEGRGVGIGMGFNRGVAKNVMYLLWTLTAYNVVDVNVCSPEMVQTLGQSMSRLVTYIQEEDHEFESTDGDKDIQSLAQALSTKLTMTN